VAIAFVNATSGGDNSGASKSSIACTAASHTTGNLIVVGCYYTGSAGSISSITDTAGNTYVKIAASSVTFTGYTGEIWYAVNVTGNASNVVTTHYSPSITFPRVVVHQYSGCATSSPFDQTATGHTASGTSVTSGNMVTTQANEVIVAFMSASNSCTWTAGASFTKRGSIVQTDTQGEDRIVSATGTYTASATEVGNKELWITAATFADTPVGGTTYNDSGSGTITLSGSSTQSQTHTATAAGTITLSGTRTESATLAGSGTGTITLSGARAESQTHTSSAAGTVTLTGSGFDEYIPPGAGATPVDQDRNATFVVTH